MNKTTQGFRDLEMGEEMEEEMDEEMEEEMDG